METIAMPIPGVGSFDAQNGAARSAPLGRSLSLLVVDDHEIVAIGFRLLLGGQNWVKRCIHATGAQEALDLARRYEPNIAVIAIELSESSGLRLIDEINRLSPRTRTLVMSNGPHVSGQTLRSLGAAGFVSKLWPVQDTLAVIRAACLGLELASPSPPGTVANLSNREHDVLTRIALGATNREIAEELYLSPHTVKQHASAAFKKIHAKNRTDAVDRARRLGLIAS